MGNRESNDVWLFLQPWAPVPLYHLIDTGNLDSSRISRLIVQGIRFVHAQGIQHRDLKPENILLTSSGIQAKVTISDFGHATDKLRSKDHMKGTITYHAPEIVALKDAERLKREKLKIDENKLKDCYWSPKSDIFSLGLVLAQLMSRHRFILKSCVHKAQHESIMHDLKANKVPLRDLIIKMISWDAKSRPDASKIIGESRWWITESSQLKRKEGE